MLSVSRADGNVRNFIMKHAPVIKYELIYLYDKKCNARNTKYV